MRTWLWLAFVAVAGDDTDVRKGSAPSEDPERSDDAEDSDESWSVDGTHGATHDVAFDLDEGTWVNVAVSGDTVVFDLLGDLWSVPLGGGEATRLTSGPSWDGQPAFSPDGTRLAFTSDRGGNENIWIA